MNNFFKKLVIIFCICFLFDKGDSQNSKKDYSYYFDKAQQFTHSNNDSLIYYAVKMQESVNQCEKITGLLYEARGHYQKGYLEKSKKLVLNSLHLQESRDNLCQLKNLIDSYRRLFYIFKNQDNYDLAYIYILKRKEVINELPVKDDYYCRNTVSVDKSLALLKMKIGAYQTARNILLKSLEDINRINKNNFRGDLINFKLERAHLFNSLGDIYLYLDKENKSNQGIFVDSASYYYEEAHRIVKKISDMNIETEIFYYQRKVKVFIARKDFKSALFYLNRYDNIIKKLSPKYNGINYFKSVCFVNTKKYDSCIVFSKRYYVQQKVCPIYKNSLITVINNLVLSYNATEKLDSAVKYSNILIDKIKYLEKKKIRSLNKINKEELNEIKELNSRLLKKQRFGTIKTYLFFVLTIILFSIIYLFTKKKTRKKNNRKIDNNIVAEILKELQTLEKGDIFIRNDFDLRFLAKKLETNVSYLSEVINKHKKVSFKQYLFKLRMGYLIDKLQNSEEFDKYSIEAIGNEIGYTNPSSFTRAFKKYTGVNPSEYIKHLRKF